MTFRQTERKSSSESSELLLSFEWSYSGLYKLIGQCCRDVIDCKTQVRRSVVIGQSRSVRKVRSFCSVRL